MTLSVADQWITSKLQQTIASVHKSFNSYRFDLAAQAIYEFTWNEYCDWYLELSKPVLQNENASAEELRGTRYTLVNVLETLLRLTHPIMPFITEEIWQRVAPLAGKQAETIMLQAYPQADDKLVDDNAIEETEWIKNFVLGVRKIRSGMDIPPGKPLDVLLQNASKQDQQWLAHNEMFVSRLARLQSIKVLDNEEPPESATALVGEMKVLIPLAGLIDKDAEIARLDKEIAKSEKALEVVNKKLGNENFVSRAPAAVVDKEKEKQTQMQTALNQLREQKDKIASM
jgi:valyl-tRNA synthetase